jgi:hypothetical protein
MAKVTIEFIRSLALSEHVDQFGNIWLVWKDRAVRLAAYYEPPF